jgi:hypothetical protein
MTELRAVVYMDAGTNLSAIEAMGGTRAASEHDRPASGEKNTESSGERGAA